MRLMRTLMAVLGLAGAACASPALADPASATPSAATPCSGGTCSYQVTPEQLLAEADRLVSLHLFAEAAPLLKALEAVPQFSMERRFLQGYSAVETGHVDEAIALFRAILVDHPEQTRVRLELARALEMKGKYGSADHHFRLAQEDRNLPADIALSVRATRGVLRDRRSFGLTLDLGLAPDTNINNGANTDTVDVNFGGFLLPLTLNKDARKRSGIGQSANISTTYRTHLSSKTKLLVDGDFQGVNYKGKVADDFALQLAAGPEIALTDSDTITMQGFGFQRWYAGKSASTGGGARLGYQHDYENGNRIGLSVDGRYSASGFSSSYSGWSLSAQAAYERVVARSMIAYVAVFGRRELVNSKSYSGNEIGLNVGIGGDLPKGVSIGVSAGVSHAGYDAPVLIFSNDPRKDWRYNARVQLGLRSVRIWGFSPSLTYNYNRVDSSLGLYRTDRHRVRFGLMRYF